MAIKTIASPNQLEKIDQRIDKEDHRNYKKQDHYHHMGQVQDPTIRWPRIEKDLVSGPMKNKCWRKPCKIKHKEIWVRHKNQHENYCWILKDPGMSRFYWKTWNNIESCKKNYHTTENVLVIRLKINNTTIDRI